MKANSKGRNLYSVVTQQLQTVQMTHNAMWRKMGKTKLNLCILGKIVCTYAKILFLLSSCTQI